jgi:hypothetical protein
MIIIKNGQSSASYGGAEPREGKVSVAGDSPARNTPYAPVTFRFLFSLEQTQGLGRLFSIYTP